MYVSVTAVETGGRLWPVAVNRILVAVVGMQALMLLTTYLEMGWQNGIAMIPPIALTLIFKIILRVQFDKDFRFFIPTNEELSRATLHGADARKNRLEKRFGDPSLHCVLFTPMLHKSIQHLLPTVYEGRVGESQEKMGSVMVDGATVGGLKFQMLEGRNLAFDRAQYLRHRDEDTMSVSTGAFGGKMEENRGGYFDERRQNYLAKGPQTPFEDNQFVSSFPTLASSITNKFR